jgi:hypothetical protein
VMGSRAVPAIYAGESLTLATFPGGIEAEDDSAQAVYTPVEHARHQFNAPPRRTTKRMRVWDAIYTSTSR